MLGNVLGYRTWVKWGNDSLTVPVSSSTQSLGLAGLVKTYGGEDRTPRYRRLRDAFTTLIEAGEMQGGEMLPSSRVLADELGLSRNTVNRAYRELVAEGFVEAIDRVGYVVNSGLGSAAGDVLDWVEDPPLPRLDWESRLDGIQVSAGDATKPADWRDYPYPFVVGPGPESFPTGAWTRAMRTALRKEHRGPSLHNLVDRDDPLLVEHIRDTILPPRGIEADRAEILVTLGSQHGIHLVAEALLSPGTRVGVEEPGYPDARDIFTRQGAETVPMPVDEEGITISGRMSGLDMLFVTPGRQFPTNVTMSIGRRRRVLSEGARNGVVIVEDDYESEYCYSHQPPPALKALDSTAGVVYVGSFSKFLAPGLRLGFVVADARLIDCLRRLRHNMLRHPPGIIQRTTALMIEAGDYGRVVRRHRRVLKSKWRTLTDALSELFPWEVRPADGGMSVWVEGPPGLDAGRLAARARATGVVIERGDPCFLSDPRPTNYFQLGFAAIELDAIRPGIERLAVLIEKEALG